jgi:hypothetical protein
MNQTRKQIMEEMARDLGLRRQAYPKLIKQGKLTAEEAEQRISAMQGAYDFIMEKMPMDFVSRFPS